MLSAPTIPPPLRWLVPLLDYIEEHLWSDSEGGGNIWNGRWTPHLLESVLTVPPDFQVTPRDFQLALKRIQQITLLLQNAQRVLYSARHIELISQEARETCPFYCPHALRSVEHLILQTPSTPTTTGRSSSGYSSPPGAAEPDSAEMATVL